MIRLKNILTLLVICLGTMAYGQSWTGQAYQFYKANDFESAQVAIDSAITTIERHDPQTWQLRGIIYRSITAGDSLYNRQIALESFVYAREIDKEGVYTDKINQYISNTLIRYYNNAVQLLMEDKNFDRSIKFYELYKEKYTSLLDPAHDFDQRDIEYYTALGAEYQNKSEIVPQADKNDLRIKSINACQKVLAIDSMDFQANFNSGIAYYNMGVDYIVAPDPEISIEELVLNTKRAEEAFLKAIPYLKRCELIQPDHMDTKVALMGCYYGLNNDEKYLKYQTDLDKINLPKYLKRYETHPTDEDNIKEIVRIYTYTMPNENEAEKYRNILYDLRMKE
jgi:tetratricopeptide (TPR) repeat protein